MMLTQADRLLHELVLPLQDNRPGGAEEGSEGSPFSFSHSRSGGNYALFPFPPTLACRSSRPHPHGPLEMLGE